MKLEKVTTGSGATTKRSFGDACGTALALEFVGERWALLVIRELLLGPRRFGEIRAGLPGLSANVLTQRLVGLEEAGIVIRRRLPPPASAPVYELTPWGYESEPIIMAMGRWALRSPLHDPSLPFSRVALMLSFRMMLVPERIGDFTATIGFRLGDEGYRVRVERQALVIERGDPGAADAIISGAPNAFLPVLYGGLPIDQSALSVEGDRATAARFTGLFALPAKIGAG
jgi:DNA-binding HxlR family transcriptional regulator